MGKCRHAASNVYCSVNDICMSHSVSSPYHIFQHYHQNLNIKSNQELTDCYHSLWFRVLCFDASGFMVSGSYFRAWGGEQNGPVQGLSVSQLVLEQCGPVQRLSFFSHFSFD